MITITTGTKNISIDINLLKKRLKKAITTVLKISAVIFAFYGIFQIVGAVGDADIDNISNKQLFFKMVMGFLYCGVAYMINIIKRVLEG